MTKKRFFIAVIVWVAIVFIGKKLINIFLEEEDLSEEPKKWPFHNYDWGKECSSD